MFRFNAKYNQLSSNRALRGIESFNGGRIPICLMKEKFSYNIISPTRVSNSINFVTSKRFIWIQLISIRIFSFN